MLFARLDKSTKATEFSFINPLFSATNAYSCHDCSIKSVSDRMTRLLQYQVCCGASILFGNWFRCERDSLFRNVYERRVVNIWNISAHVLLDICGGTIVVNDDPLLLVTCRGTRIGKIIPNNVCLRAALYVSSKSTVPIGNNVISQVGNDFWGN